MNENRQIIRANNRRTGAAAIEATDAAQAVGYKVPVYISAEVWRECIRWTSADNQATGACHTEAGRLLHLLFTSALAVRRANTYGRGRFMCHCLKRWRGVAEPQATELQLSIGDNGRGQVVASIHFPHE